MMKNDLATLLNFGSACMASYGFGRICPIWEGTLLLPGRKVLPPTPGAAAFPIQVAHA